MRSGVRAGGASLRWAAVLAIGLLSARGALAAPQTCPSTSGTSRCEVATGDTDVVVLADADGSRLLVDSWSVGGVSQLAYEGVTLRLSSSQTLNVTLEEASVDPATGAIFLSYLESGNHVRLTATFAVSDSGPISRLDETLSVTSLSQSVSLRLYVVTDFDLDGSSTDDSAVSSADGIVFMQEDGGMTGQVVVVSPPPDAFQVDVCCELGAIIDQDATFDLSGATYAAGPDNFQHALSWDRTLGAGLTLTTVLRKTIAVPEPAAGLGAAVAILALLGLVGGRASREDYSRSW